MGLVNVPMRVFLDGMTAVPLPRAIVGAGRRLAR